VCCAFTGKAASRMEQSEVDTDKLVFPPKTIHSLMAAIKFGGGVEIDMVIIDEASTMNSELFNMFIIVLSKSSTLNKIKFLFVGDSNQLPPIGGGQIFEDIIRNNLYPTHRLTKIFRTTDEHMLSLYSDVINTKHIVNRSNHKKYFKSYNPTNVDIFLQKIVELLFKKDHGWYKDNKCVIVTHTNKYVDYINYLCYKNINGSEIPYYEYTFTESLQDYRWEPIPWIWIGAKIVFTKNDVIDVPQNNGDIRVTNGTVGEVVDILNGLVLIKNYDTGDSFYVDMDYDTVKLAFGLTVFKSQGSEAPFIIYIHSNHIYEAKRLAYTAITRAKQNLKIYTPTDGFKLSMDVKRYTLLNSK